MTTLVQRALAPTLLVLLAGGAGWSAASHASGRRRGDRTVRSAGSGYGVEDVTPVGADAAWAITSGNEDTNAPQAIVRTTDGGARWSSVTPARLRRLRASDYPVLDVLTASRAWVTFGGDYTRQTVLTTADGGRRWTRVGRTPDDCQVDFINSRDGWCVAADGATGNATVFVYRTTNGGGSWREVSHTGLYGKGSSRGALPFGCDKSVVFAAPADGFASTYCNGGRAYIALSRDAGARWAKVLQGPVDDGGSNFDRVVAYGRDLAAGFLGTGARGPTDASVYRSDDLGRMWTRVRPPGRSRAYDVDTVSPSVWRLLLGRAILATNDAGRTWTNITSNVRLPHDGTLEFTSESVGWDVETSVGTHILRTTDGGRHWTTVHVPAP